MATNSARTLGYQLKMDGKAETVNDFKAVESAAKASMDGFADAAEQAADRADKAGEAYTSKQIDRWQKQATAAKLAAAGMAANASVDAAMAGSGNARAGSINFAGSSGPVNLDRSTGAARESAAAFQEAFAVEEAAARAAADAEALAAQAEADRAGAVAKLRAALDPLSVAQGRFNQEVAAADELVAAGAISTEEHAAALQLYAARLETTRVSLDGAAAAEQQLEARTRAFLSALDPAYASQQRFDREMVEARSLISQGAISLDQYCAKLRQETTLANGASEAHGRYSTSTMIVDHVVRSMADSIAAGQSPMRAASMEMGRITEALNLWAMTSNSTEGVAGKLAGFMSGPWGIALTVAGAVLTPLIGNLIDGANAADQMKEHQQALASMIDQTTGRIKEQSAALLLNAAAMSTKDAKAAQSAADDAKRRITDYALMRPGAVGPNGEVSESARTDPRVDSAVRQFAKGGSVDDLAKRLNAISAASPGLKRTTDDIVAQAAAFTTASRQVDQYNAQVRLLTNQAKPGDRRTALGQFGPEAPDLSLADAKAKLAAASTNSQRAEAQATITRIEAKKAFDNGSIGIDEYTKRMTAADAAVNATKEHTDKHAASLARQAESMEVSARGALDVAAAYLKSADAGSVAEARRKAATDATRKGIDVDAQAARQMALSSAEQVMNSAKSIAGMNAESGARESVLAQVKSGGISTDEMNDALKTEAALRPLLAARAYLHGDALKTLNDVIDATPGAIERASAAQAKFDLPGELEASLERTLELKAQLADLADNPFDRAVNAAQRAANIEADRKKFGEVSPERHSLVTAAEDEAREKYRNSEGQFRQQTLDSQSDSLALSQREMQLLGANDNYRTSELDKLKLQLQIRRQFPLMAQADVDRMIAGVAAVDAMAAQLKIAAAGMQELRGFGSELVDDVLSPDKWSSWGDAGKAILKDIENEFIKLALLNPIKNMINGNSDLPGLGSVFSKLTSVFGGSGLTANSFGDAAAASLSSIKFLPHNATGTQDWTGGRTWVNENGPEIEDLPSGTRIYPAALSREMAANDNGGRGDVHNHFYLDGAVVDQQLYEKMLAVGDNAAMRGAAGGAALSETNATARQVRKLGRSW